MKKTLLFVVTLLVTSFVTNAQQVKDTIPPPGWPQKKKMKTVTVECKTTITWTEADSSVELNRKKHSTIRSLPVIYPYADFFAGRKPVTAFQKKWKLKQGIKGFNFFIAVPFKQDFREKPSFGLFAGYSAYNLDGASGNLDGMVFNFEHNLDVSYFGGSFFYKKFQIGIGHEWINDNEIKSHATCFYLKYGVKYFASFDDKKQSYFGFATPISFNIGTSTKISPTERLKISFGGYFSKSGIGPIVKICAGDFAAFSLYWTVKNPTVGFNAYQ